MIWDPSIFLLAGPKSVFILNCWTLLILICNTDTILMTTLPGIRGQPSSIHHHEPAAVTKPLKKNKR